MTAASRLVSLHERERIEPVLRRDVFLHLYALGDLDPFFWPHTTWYGLELAGSIEAVLLLYTAYDPPTLMALADDAGPMQELLRRAGPFLPPRTYAHLSPGCATALEPWFRVHSHGRFYKMALADHSRLDEVDASGVKSLGPAHRDELLELYAVSYPGNWFDPRMLETGQYYGIRGAEGLVGVAGVHVYSLRYRVAALGNIATRPSHRGRGLARAATARLCKSLAEQIDHIGLNVKADNGPAVACYERLGFRRIADYEECTVTLANSEPAGS